MKEAIQKQWLKGIYLGLRPPRRAERAKATRERGRGDLGGIERERNEREREKVSSLGSKKYDRFFSHWVLVGATAELVPPHILGLSESHPPVCGLGLIS